MKKRFLGIVCIIYFLLIIYVFIINKLKNFLAPNMHIYIILMLPILLTMGVVNIKEGNYKFNPKDLILLLPVLLIITSNDGRLTTNFSKNRMSSFETKITHKKEIKKEKENTKKKYDYDIVDEVYMDLSNFITFAEKQKQFIGKTIRIRGFVNKHQQYVPKGYFAIGKYGVSCCTADAGFVGFFVKETKTVEENKWYEIEGTLEKAKDTAGYDRIAIEIKNIKEINSKKEEEYVYPCYAYKDGKCEEMKKYNFEY